MKSLLKKVINIRSILAIILTISTFFISKYVCQPRIFTAPNVPILYYFLRVVFLIVFFFVYLFIINFIIKLKQKSLFYKNWLKYTLIYFIILSIFLLLIWPGHWVWDEFSLISDAASTNINVWHSYITIIFMTIALMIIPYPVGVVIFQVIAISLIFGYLIARLKNSFNNKWLIFAMYILFMLPAVLINNMYPLRLPMYAYAMLLLFTIIIFDYIDKRKMNLKKFIVLLVLMSLVILWRSEGLIYLVFLPIILYFAYKRSFNFKKVCAVFLLLIVIFVTYNKALNMIEVVPISSKRYSLTIYVNPLSMMLQQDLKGKSLNRDLENIDKVLSIEDLKENPSYSEIPAFWKTDCVREDFAEHLDDFKLSYINLILNNPVEFLKARFKTFFAANGLDKEYLGASYGAITQYYNNTIDKETFIYKDVIDLKYMQPINNDIRTKIVTSLVGIDLDDNVNQFVTSVFWNFIPIMIIIFVLMFTSLFKKRYVISLICLTTLGKIAIIFLTEPASYFMYYFPDYLLGFLLIIVSIGLYIKEKTECKNISLKQKTNNVNNKNEKIDSLIVKKSTVLSLIIQAIKYYLISGIAWILDVVIFTILCNLIPSTIFANIISSTLGATFTFVVSTRKTFKNNSKKFSIKTKYIIYIVYQIILILVMSVVLAKFSDLLYYNVPIDLVTSYSKFIAKIIITPITMLLNFIFMKVLIERI